MPYIKGEQRWPIDDRLLNLLDYLDATPVNQLDGQVNYAITRIMQRLYKPSYFNLNRAIGVLECAKQELYRRIVAPYEDQKIIENGDLTGIDDSAERGRAWIKDATRDP